MISLDDVDVLVSRHLSVLVDWGQVRYTKIPSSEDPIPRKTLGIYGRNADFEIRIWEFNGVLLSYGTAEHPHQEHYDVSSFAELEALFDKFLKIIEEWKDK